MNLNLWRRFSQKSIVRSIACIVVVSALFEPLAASASFKSNLQGLNSGSTNWGGGPLTGYNELDYVPARTLFTGGPATNQVITVDFDHTKSGTLRGIEDLTDFTNSPNVIIVSGPTLSTPTADVWRYTYTITITNALDGFVEFRARLSAGSHLFTGSSLSLSSPTLSIFKPSAQPGFPDLAIAKRGPNQAKPGQIITYTINYTNLASAATTAKGVQVSDILPAAVTYVAGSANKGGTVTGNTITWDLGNVAPGKRGLLTYKVMVSTNIPITTVFSNFAQILGSQDDANSADNSSSVTTTVVVNPTLVANDDFYATDKNLPLTIPAPGVLTNDTSSVTNTLTAVLLSIPDNGSVVLNADGSFTYTPLTTYVGIDQFAYFITVGTNSSGPAVVTINDTNSCDFTVTNIIVSNDPGVCGAAVNYPAPVTTGLCGPISCLPTNGSFFPVGSNTVTCSSSDGIVHTFVITVRDTQAPAITCPSNLVVAANSGCNATNVSLGSPVVSDNCSVSMVTNNAPASFASGTNVVTWTVFDSSGNSNTCQQRVVVSDLVPPTITCPSNIVVAANNGCNATNVFLGAPVAADNCGAVTVSNNAPASFPSGTNVVTWTAIDGSGNTATCQQIVVVLELTPPTISCPSNVTFLANSGCGATNLTLGSPVVFDSCGVAAVTNNAPSFYSVGTNIVTWTVVDSSGNTASCQQLVIVRDSTAPTISCPTNIFVSANSGCSATNVNLGAPIAADNCSVMTVTNDAPSVFVTGTNVVTWTAVDNSGNTATCQQLVIVRDLTLPAITCPSNIIVTANSGCGATNVVLGSPVTADDCGVAAVTNNAPAVFVLGTNVVTWTATDTSGNTSSCQQLVIVRDQIPPSITCPSNLIVAANSGCNATNVNLGTPVAADNCGIATVTNNAPAALPSGTNVITWTAVDNSGNTATCQQLVVVRDQTPPIITCPSDVTVTANSGCSATNVALGTPVTSDNCSGVAILTNNAPNTFPSGTNVVTWTAVDNVGNVATCQQLVIVHEPSIPTITCPADVVVTANAGCAATNVNLGVPVTGDVCAVAGVTNNAPAAFPLGTNIVIWTVRDNSGNTATCQQKVVVRDLTVPSITCPSNLVIAANSGCNATNVNLGTPVTSDNCGIVTVTNNAPAVMPLGTNVVTWTVVDNSGNTASCQQLAVVRDQTPPSISCPSNVIVTANSGCSATNVSLGAPVTSDNCGIATLTNNAPSVFLIGTNAVTWTAVDNSGNTATCQQLVIVRDLVVPTITCPSNLIVAANSGCGATNVVLGSPVTADNCGVTTVTNNAPAVFALGTNTVTWTVTDTSGNTASCQQLIIVRDQTSPTITCSSNLVLSANSGCNATNVNLGTPVTTDNCGIATVTNNAPAVMPLGTNVVTWTVVDNSGNTASCQQLVVVRDQTSPSISCPSNVIVTANSGCSATNVSLGAPVTSDNCGIATVTNNAPANFPSGTNAVTWTAVDNSGNTATCQQLVIVRDLVVPTIICPSNLIVAANSGCGATNVVLGSPVTADNCGVATVTNNAPAVFALGTNIVTWTVTDTGGNTATCQQLIFVRDQTLPTIACPSNLIATANSGCNATNVNLGTPITTDNCGIATVSNNAPAALPLGTNVVTWTVVDNSGNTASCQQLVVVRDQTPPTITCPSTLIVAVNAGCTATNVSLTAPTTSDNCGILTVSNNATASFQLGTNVVTWTAVDTSGNTATCQQLVVVRDQVPPTITCPSNVVVTANSGCNATNVALGSPATTDNCSVASVTNNAPASYPLGTNFVTWTATDTSGNSASCQQLVVVRDQTPPTITCPSTVVIAANSGCSATNVSLGSPVTSDNCGVASVTNNAPASFPAGTNSVTWTVVDTSGNTATCQQLVVVRDQTLPAITCPSTLIVAVNDGCTATNVSLTAPATSDNCGILTVTNSAPASFPLGTNVVTWTAVDNSGNTATCQQLVVVRDQVSPTITCPSNLVVSANSGCSATNVALGTPVTSDNCGVASVTNNAPASFPAGTNSVTWTVVDTSGNTATCQQLVVVRDQTPPAITCPANIVRSTDPGQCSASNITFTATAADNCSPGVSISYDPASGSTFPKGVTTVTATATDGNGNSSTCTFTVTVNDTEKPTIICPGNAVVSSPFGQTPAVVGYSPTATDNCPGVTTTCVPASGSSFPVGVTTVTCTATDASGNTNTCTFTVTVNPSAAGILVAEFITSPMVLNRQTGLFEQSMRVRNAGSTTVNGSRVYVLGLPSTNTLYNRNGAGTPSGSSNVAPYVEYDLPLAPGSNVVFLLEYYLPNLKAITNQSLVAEQVVPAQPTDPPPGAQSVALQTGRGPLQLANGRFLIEWPAIVGRSYMVQYSSDMTNWKTAVKSIVAAGTAVQWMDDGPPKTDTPPSQAGSRFYRVFLLPAN